MNLHLVAPKLEGRPENTIGWRIQLWLCSRNPYVNSILPGKPALLLMHPLSYPYHFLLCKTISSGITEEYEFNKIAIMVRVLPGVVLFVIQLNRRSSFGLIIEEIDSILYPSPSMEAVSLTFRVGLNKRGVGVFIGYMQK
jgi:hypothetical protein